MRVESLKGMSTFPMKRRYNERYRLLRYLLLRAAVLRDLVVEYEVENDFTDQRNCGEDPGNDSQPSLAGTSNIPSQR